MVVGDEPKNAVPEGWTELFNGRDLTGWVIEGTKENRKSGEAKPVWSVQDGVIHCEGSGFGFLRFDKEYCDFVLHVEYRLTRAATAASASAMRSSPARARRGHRTPAMRFNCWTTAAESLTRARRRHSIATWRQVAAGQKTRRMEHHRDRMPRNTRQNHSERRAGAGRRSINNRRNQNQAALWVCIRAESRQDD